MKLRGDVALGINIGVCVYSCAREGACSPDCLANLAEKCSLVNRHRTELISEVWNCGLSGEGRQETQPASD